MTYTEKETLTIGKEAMRQEYEQSAKDHGCWPLSPEHQAINDNIKKEYDALMASKP